MVSWWWLIYPSCSAKLLLKEEINVMTMIDRWSSNYKHELQALCSQELELREKFKAYRAEEHHRLLEVKSHSLNFKFGCKFPDGWTKTYRYFGHCINVNLVEITFSNMLSICTVLFRLSRAVNNRYQCKRFNKTLADNGATLICQESNFGSKICTYSWSC